MFPAGRSRKMALRSMLVDLSTTPFPEVLLRLSSERRSGDLVVRYEKAVKTVFFDRGRLVFAASNLKKDRLGEALVTLGRITDAQFQKASALMKAKDRRKHFGEALVEAGVMDKDEVGTAVARQVRLIVLSLFSLPGGVASFDDRPCVIPMEYMVGLSVHRLIYAGIKTMTDQHLILAGLGNLNRQVRLSRVPPFKFLLHRCSASERDILERARKAVSLEQLASIDGTLTLGRLRAAYSLLASGVLEDPAASGTAEPIVQMDTGTFLMSGLRRQPEPSQLEALRLELQREIETSAKLDIEGWLAVAPPHEVARAVEEKMARYSSLLERAGDDPQLRTSIEVVLGRAAAVLHRVRAAAAGGAVRELRPDQTVPAWGGRAALARQAEAVPAGAPPTGSPTRRVVLPGAAAPSGEPKPPRAVPLASSQTIPAPTPEPPPLADETPAVERFEVEAPPAVDDAARHAPPEPPPVVSEPGPVAAPVEELTLMDVERLLMEADVRMTISDYANAVKSYGKLVDLMPNVAAYRLKLAIAMTCWPRTAKLAERQFLEALRLEPNNANLHYQFGLYYKAMKQRARALTEMRTALSLDPRHKEARKELEVLSPKDSALTSLKKLFR